MSAVLVCGLSAFPVSAVDTSQSYVLSVTSEGESSFSVDKGEPATVQLKLDRTDRDGSFLMYAFSCRIRFNSSMLELAEYTPHTGVDVTVTELSGALSGWSDITLNALSASFNGTSWNDPETVLTLTFRGRQYGSSALMIRNASVSTCSGMESFYCETKDAQVNVQKPKEPDHICPSAKFTDVNTEAWYHPYIDYVLTREYFKGISDSAFMPDSTMTRAMFVTVLSRLDGAGLSSYAGNDFADVAVGSWYAAPVQWASQNGIVTGIGNRRFDPDANVTREQMAVIMYRYSEYKGMETGQTDRAKYEAFTDHDRVSDWAAEAVIWAVSRKLVNGMGDGTLAPSAASTRAQVAKIVSQYDELIAGNSSTGEAG